MEFLKEHAGRLHSSYVQDIQKEEEESPYYFSAPVDDPPVSGMLPSSLSFLSF